MSDVTQDLLAFRQVGDLPLARKRMLARLGGLGLSQRVLNAMEAVPRHAFVPAPYWRLAYAEIGLWLPSGAALPAPELAARILSALEPTTTDRLLEIGTGCGYLTTLLGSLCASVTTLDRIDYTHGALQAAGLNSVHQSAGADAPSWWSQSHFDAIVINEATSLPPIHLLAYASRLVAVVGLPAGPQRLILVTLDESSQAPRVSDLGPLVSPTPAMALAVSGGVLSTATLESSIPGAIALEGAQELEGTSK